MKTMQTILGILIGVLLIGTANARDTRAMYSIADALVSAGSEKVGDDIQFFFGDQHPSVDTDYGTFTSNKKTNGFGKSDTLACQRAFLSAVLSFQQRARDEGGNAVIKLRSFYKSKPVSSATEFECGSGAVISGVALRGDVVRLRLSP